MTASRHESTRRRLTLVVLALLTACRAGLPPDPPDADPVNASADIPPYRPPANPYDTSAFAGAAVPASSGHEGHGSMNHGAGQMGHTMNPAPAAAPAPAGGHEQMDHSAHTATPAKPAPVDHSAHTGKASPTPEPRR